MQLARAVPIQSVPQSRRTAAPRRHRFHLTTAAGRRPRASSERLAEPQDGALERLHLAARGGRQAQRDLQRALSGARLVALHGCREGRGARQGTGGVCRAARWVRARRGAPRSSPRLRERWGMAAH